MCRDRRARQGRETRSVVDLERRGLALKAMRNRQGLTQSQLADLIEGISPQAISEWERGKSAPSAGHLFALDDILEADGGVFDLYGHIVATENELLNRLSAAIDRVESELASLRRAFEAHLAEVHGDDR